MFKWLKKKNKTQDGANYSMDDLAAEILDVLKSYFPNDVYLYHPETKMIEKTGVKEGEDFGLKISLPNTFNRIKSDSPEARHEYLSRLIGQMTEDKPQDTEDFKSHIYYRVRTAEEMANRALYMKGMGAKDYNPLAAEIGDLRLEYVRDMQDTVSLLSSDDFETHALSAADAAQITQDNMIDVTSNATWQAQDGFWISPFNDDYDAARVISLHPRGKLPFEGDPIVFMPSHSICLVTDTFDADILAKMAATGQELSHEHRPLSSRFWTFGAGGWSPLTAKPDHPAYQIIYNQTVIENLSAYDEQKRCLDENYEKNGEDIFVASYSALQNDDGDIIPYAVLSLGVDALLPKTDNVIFFDHEAPEDQQTSGLIRWEVFVKIIGEDKIIECKDLYPPRYDFINRLNDNDQDRIRKAVAEL
ncbi:MAG: hypothetical protein ACPGVT_02125 [Maricaulaceae bacterium]